MATPEELWLKARKKDIRPQLNRAVGLGLFAGWLIIVQAWLLAADGRAAGRVSSGSFAPSAGGPVAMAYVAAEFAVPAGTLYAQVRGRAVPMQLQPMPFVPHRYWRG